MFELVNLIHHELADDPIQRTLPFSGKQLILIGEFLQLWPVPNMFDEGHYMSESPSFDFAICHRFALTKVMRKSKEEKQLLKVLSELPMGECGHETEQYIYSLNRDLPQHLLESVTHIFFRKIPITLRNRQELDKLPGELITLEAVYENESSKSMSWPVASVSQLIQGCKVMLVWNKSDELKNGTVGVFNGVRGDSLLVSFEGVGEEAIGKETWVKRAQNCQKVGIVTQFPLVLAYAVTCHKSQGLTLPSAKVHCSREYVSGLVYVAILRVKSPDHIQVQATK